MSDWILLSERKPSQYKFEDLEVTTKEGKREIAFYYADKDQWFNPTTLNLVEVIAWKEPSKPLGKLNVGFKERLKLVKEYEQWLVGNPGIKDCPLSFVSFLERKGVLHL